MHIFAGSYERFIFGFTANADCSQEQDIVKKYTFAAHKSAVKSLVASGPYVASGGADDLIHLYDMKSERDLGTVMNPCDGAVPCLTFYTPESRAAPSHLFSGSADGGINIWRCRDWEHLKVMRGHRGAVNAVAVHGSGRIALSVARDKAIRMWNLAKGRCTYTAPLEAEAEAVAFTPSGDAYSLVCGSKITLHSTTGEGALLSSYTAPRRILAVAQQSEQLLLLGTEDGGVTLWDVRSGGRAGGWERAHASRVRGLAILQEGPGGVPASLASASSDGTLRLWDTRMLGGGAAAAAGGQPPPACTAQVATGARLTCLAAADPHAPPRVAAAGVKAAGAKQAKAGKKKAKAQEGGAAGGRQGEGAGAPAKLQKLSQESPARQQKPQQRPQQRPQQKAQQAAVERPLRGAPVGPPGSGGPKHKTKPQQKPKAAAPRRGAVEDDMGFEIVPAARDDDDAAGSSARPQGQRPGKAGTGGAGAEAGGRGEGGKAAAAKALGAGRGRKRALGEAGDGPAAGREAGPAAGTSGRGGEGKRGQQAEAQERPGKKQKVQGVGGAGAGAAVARGGGGGAGKGRAGLQAGGVKRGSAAAGGGGRKQEGGGGGRSAGFSADKKGKKPFKGRK